MSEKKEDLKFALTCAVSQYVYPYYLSKLASAVLYFFPTTFLEIAVYDAQVKLFLEYGRHVARLRTHARTNVCMQSARPASHAASHDNHENANAWFSYFLCSQGPLRSSASKRFKISLCSATRRTVATFVSFLKKQQQQQQQQQQIANFCLGFPLTTFR